MNAIAQVPQPAAPSVSVVIPTYNEVGNVGELVSRLDRALSGRAWEAIFVDDDSADGTAEAVRGIAATDPRIRCIVRIGRRGLSRAVAEGMLASAAPCLAVLDADLQHDVSRLPVMLDELARNDLDVVIASRYCDGGTIGAWDGRRARMSAIATAMGGWIVPQRLTDPMSGFFVITRPAFEQTVRRLSGEGYKILLDLFASTPRPFRFAEVPYAFGERAHGESKLDTLAVWEFLMLLLDKRLGGWIPARFVLFCVVGLSGVAVHVAVLSIALHGLRQPFAAAQVAATLVAMTSNFAINNVLTYRDMRLRGWQWLGGWASFCLLCGLGIVANVGVANLLFEKPEAWWVAGIAGAAVGAVWNYAASSVFTWGRTRRRSRRPA